MKQKIFKDDLMMETTRENHLLEKAEEFLRTAPKGSLAVKQRKKSRSYYWNIDEERGACRYRSQININDNPELIHTLTEKMLQKEILRRCEQNLKRLEKLERNFQPVEMENIRKALSPQYQEVLHAWDQQRIEKWRMEPYSKAPFDSKIHIHETDCGILVRSKSEQLLTNALYAYEIPFHYEEEFIHHTGVRRRIFPDFTILLPDGERILWEHLGLLSDKGYCENTVLKLQIYQLSGYTIGKNLILTMDDNRGDCSSAIINQTIRSQILPHFQKAGKSISSPSIIS